MSEYAGVGVFREELAHDGGERGRSADDLLAMPRMTDARALAAMDVAPALPDISGSLRALRERSGASTPVAPALAPAPAPADATIGEQ